MARYHQLLNLLGVGCLLVLLAACSSGADQTVRVWNAKTGNTLLTYPEQFTTVVTLAWSLNGTHIASAGLSQLVQVWQA